MTGKTITAKTYSTADCTGAISQTLTFSSGACGASTLYGSGQETVTYVAPVSNTIAPTAAVTLAPTATRVPTAALSLAPTSKQTQVPSIKPAVAASYFVTKKYSDSACSILITGSSTELGACLPVFVNSGYTRTTATANYASTIAYSDSACTVSTSAEKTMFLSDTCVFDASSGYLKTTVTATPSFVSSSEGGIAR